MTITEVPATLASTIAHHLISEPRSPGLHVSAIIADLDRRLNRKRGGGITEEELSEYGTMGFIWELILERVLADLTMSGGDTYFRPGEQSHGGMHLTPDYMSASASGFVLEEWKVRWKSAARADALESNFWKEIVQIKAYCYVLQTLRARLRILFVCGDWHPPTPKVREFTFTFTERELEENWQMLVAHAKSKGWL